jgi:hypothetical protein
LLSGIANVGPAYAMVTGGMTDPGRPVGKEHVYDPDPWADGIESVREIGSPQRCDEATSMTNGAQIRSHARTGGEVGV